MEIIFNFLSKVPSEALVGLVGVMLGAVISIFGVWITNRSCISQLRIQLEHEKNTTESTLQREKLEELYLLLDKWLNALFGQSRTLLLVMKGDLDYNQHLDIIIEDDKEKSVDFGRLRMIANIYGHALQPSYQKIINAKTVLNKIEDAHMHSYKIGDIDGRIYIKSYTDARNTLENLTLSFMKEVADHIKLI